MHFPHGPIGAASTGTPRFPTAGPRGAKGTPPRRPGTSAGPGAPTPRGTATPTRPLPQPLTASPARGRKTGVRRAAHTQSTPSGTPAPSRAPARHGRRQRRSPLPLPAPPSPPPASGWGGRVGAGRTAGWLPPPPGRPRWPPAGPGLGGIRSAPS